MVVSKKEFQTEFMTLELTVYNMAMKATVYNHTVSFFSNKTKIKMGKQSIAIYAHTKTTRFNLILCCVYLEDNRLGIA